MSTATKKKTSKAKAKTSAAKATKAKTSKAKVKVEKLPPSHPDVVKAKEKDLFAKYGPNGTKAQRKLVRESTQWDKKRNKYTIDIICNHPGCKERRTVATSDLFQVEMCEEHTKEKRNQARAEKRKANAKPAKAKPAKAKKTSAKK